jgi:hypothetical protein
MSERASRRSESAAVGLEYTTEGGWPSPVGSLIRWLRASGCGEYARPLEKHAKLAYRLEEDYLASPRTAPQLATALCDLRNGLAPLTNNPPPFLTPDHHQQLKDLRRKAFRFIQFRLWQLDRSHDGYERAVTKVAMKLAKLSTEAPQASAATMAEPATHQARPASEATSKRLILDPETLTATLDGIPHKVNNPKAFAVYQVIVEAGPQPVTKGDIRLRVKGVRGVKKIPQLLMSLPAALEQTVSSSVNGYYIDLLEHHRRKPAPRRKSARPRKKGST